MKRLRRLGYQPYFLLEEWEVPVFRERFQRSSPLGALDWPPAVRLEYARSRSGIPPTAGLATPSATERPRSCRGRSRCREKDGT
jgi:hypothetical protein